MSKLKLDSRVAFVKARINSIKVALYMEKAPGTTPSLWREAGLQAEAELIELFKAVYAKGKDAGMAHARDLLEGE